MATYTQFIASDGMLEISAASKEKWAAELEALIAAEKPYANPAVAEWEQELEMIKKASTKKPSKKQKKTDVELEYEYAYLAGVPLWKR